MLPRVFRVTLDPKDFGDGAALGVISGPSPTFGDGAAWGAPMALDHMVMARPVPYTVE